MASKDNKTKSYVKFDRKDAQKFWEWATKTKAVAARKGWLEAITNDVTLDRTSKKEEDKAAVLKNDLAYHYLVMACTYHAFGYVQAAETVDSHGDEHKARKDLCKRYNDVMENGLIALTMEYNNCKMKKASDDPCLWYAELEHLQWKMEHAGAQKKTEAEVVAFIMSQISTKYEVVLSALRVKSAKEWTLELVKMVYLEYWGAKFKGVEQPNESDGNVTLYANSGKKGDGKKQNYKKFKGNCNYCGIQGHKLADCCRCKAVEKNDSKGAKPLEKQSKNGNHLKRMNPLY